MIFPPKRNNFLLMERAPSTPITQTTLSRCVRIVLAAGTPPAPPASNTFAGFPSVNSVPLWSEIVIEVTGTPKKGIGYVTSLAQIDQATRLAAAEAFPQGAVSALQPRSAIASKLTELSNGISAHLGHPIARLTWRVSPYHHYSWDRTMPTTTTLSCQFEFAAAHRLNDPQLTAEENLALFGKCNRPNGHGHNYKLEVAVLPPQGPLFGMADLERVVAGTVLDRFDHRNLNVDCAEFATLNPTVENIAAVCFDLLRPMLEDEGVTLQRVTVWETSKTSATVEVAP